MQNLRLALVIIFPSHGVIWFFMVFQIMTVTPSLKNSMTCRLLRHTPLDFFIDSDRILTMRKEIPVEEITLPKLRRVCVVYKVAGYRKTEAIIITLIMNWLKSVNL